MSIRPPKFPTVDCDDSLPTTPLISLTSNLNLVISPILREISGETAESGGNLFRNPEDLLLRPTMFVRDSFRQPHTLHFNQEKYLHDRRKFLIYFPPQAGVSCVPLPLLIRLYNEIPVITAIKY